MSAAPTADGPARYIVRHGAMRLLGEFTAADGSAFDRVHRVVVRTERGQELGDVLCPSTPQAIAHAARLIAQSERPLILAGHGSVPETFPLPFYGPVQRSLSRLGRGTT